MAKRVLIAEFMHETNTFSVQLTDEAVFRHHGVFRDNEVPKAFQGTRTSMGAVSDAGRVAPNGSVPPGRKRAERAKANGMRMVGAGDMGVVREGVSTTDTKERLDGKTTPASNRGRLFKSARKSGAGCLKNRGRLY